MLFTTISIKFIALFINLYMVYFVVRNYNLEVSGLYFFQLSWLALFGLVFFSGFNRTLMLNYRANSFFYSKLMWVEIINYLIGLALVMTFLVFITEEYWLYSCLLLYVASSLSVIHRINGRNINGNIEATILRPIIFLCVLNYFKSTNLIVLYSISIAISSVFVSIGIDYSKLTIKFRFVDFKKLLSYTAIAMVVSFEYVINNLDQILVGFFLKKDLVSHMKVFLSAKSFVMLPIFSLSMILPYILKNKVATKDIERNIFIIMLTGGVLFLILNYFYSDHIIMYAFGSEFVYISNYLYVLIIPIFTLALNSTFVEKCVNSGVGYYLFIGMLTIVTIFMIVNYQLSKSLGVEVFFISSSLSTAIFFSYARYLYLWKK